MSKFLAANRPDGAGVVFVNLDSIIRAERLKLDGTLTITLVDGFSLSLGKQDSEAVLEFIKRRRFVPGGSERVDATLDDFTRWAKEFDG
jgi:hypothetical protein